MYFSFEYYYTKLRPRMVFFACRLLHDIELSEDLVEDIFLKMYEEKHLSTIQAGSGEIEFKLVKQYLDTSVYRKAINLKEEKKLHYKIRKSIKNQLSVHETPSFLNNIIYTEVVSEVHSAINTLPIECKKVFISLYIEGDNIHDTSEKLGVTVSTVKNQKRIGLKKIRKLFGTTKEKAEQNNLILINKIRQSSMCVAKIAKLYNLDDSTINYIRRSNHTTLRLY